MPDPPGPPLDLVAVLADIETRLAALETHVGRVEEEQPDADEVGRLRWFMKHGRRRPW